MRVSRCIDKIVVLLVIILQVDSGGLLSRLAHVTNTRDQSSKSQTTFNNFLPRQFSRCSNMMFV